MSIKDESSSGTHDPAASGAGDQDKKKETVLYDTHLKVLNEKKIFQEKANKLEEELDSIRKEKADKERAELEQQGNWKKLLEEERVKAQKLQADHEGLLNTLKEASKRKAVLRYVSGKVPDEVVGALLSVEGVAVNEDGSVNEDTAKMVAQEFEKKYPYVVLRDNKNGQLPGHAASGTSSQKLSYKEWLQLDTKEMKKRSNEVDWTTA